MAGRLCILVLIFASFMFTSVCEASYYRYRPSPSPPPPKYRSWKPKPKPKPKPSLSPIYPVPSDNSLAAQFMLQQNIARANVGLKPLIWDSKLESFAQDWANQRAAFGNCQLQHSDGPYGENIFWGGGKAWSAKEASAAWVEEKEWYDYNSNSCASGQQCGHYTQIVWRDSQRIGCARVECSSGDVFMTCNYDPPGNYIGEKPY